MSFTARGATGVADNSVCSPLVQSDVSQRATETSRRRSSGLSLDFHSDCGKSDPRLPFCARDWGERHSLCHGICFRQSVAGRACYAERFAPWTLSLFA